MAPLSMSLDPTRTRSSSSRPAEFQLPSPPAEFHEELAFQLLDAFHEEDAFQSWSWRSSSSSRSRRSEAVKPALFHEELAFQLELAFHEELAFQLLDAFHEELAFQELEAFHDELAFHEELAVSRSAAARSGLPARSQATAALFQASTVDWRAKPAAHFLAACSITIAAFWYAPAAIQARAENSRATGDHSTRLLSRAPEADAHALAALSKIAALA